MRVTITIDCDNAAFDNLEGELDDILHRLADWVNQQGVQNSSIHDSDGNVCGAFHVTI